MELKGSQTEENLKAAFAGESQANRRYLYFAQKADIEGHNDVAAVFRSTAEGETGHAHGHLEYLEACGDPATGEPIGDTVANLKASIVGETHEYTDMYPGMARPPATKVSTKSPTGSKLWPRLKRATPASSRRRSTACSPTRDLKSGGPLGRIGTAHPSAQTFYRGKPDGRQP